MIFSLLILSLPVLCGIAIPRQNPTSLRVHMHHAGMWTLQIILAILVVLNRTTEIAESIYLRDACAHDRELHSVSFSSSTNTRVQLSAWGLKV